MGCITKGQKLSAKDLPRFKYKLPELGEGAYANLRAMSAKEAQAFSDKAEELAKSGSGGAPANGDGEMYHTLALSIVDDDGEPIFASAKEVREQLECSAASLVGMFRKVISLSGLDVDRAKN